MNPSNRYADIDPARKVLMLRSVVIVIAHLIALA